MTPVNSPLATPGRVTVRTGKESDVVREMPGRAGIPAGTEPAG